jgi:S1-C subfamily serine protease
MPAEQGDLPPPEPSDAVFVEPDMTTEVVPVTDESMDSARPGWLQQPWFAGALSGAIVAMVIVLLTGRADPRTEVLGAVTEPDAAVTSSTVAQADWGWMGIGTDDADGPGVTVTVVEPESPAAVAGVLLDDVIVEFDGVLVDSPDELTALVRNAKADHSARLDIVRNGSPVALFVELGQRPSGD